MNAYDFDKTIFYPDSSCTFVLYCLRRYPKAVLPSIPGMGAKALGRCLGRCGTKELKEQVFSFLPRLKDMNKILEDFWNENRHRIWQWYLDQRREDDVIISASPEFLLEPVCKELGVRLIGTRMDPHTGKIQGNNCHDSEKVERLYAAIPGALVDEFYSDSLSDTPMARIAAKAYLVKKDKLYPWPEESGT